MIDVVRDELLRQVAHVRPFGAHEVVTLLVTVKAYPAVGKKTGEAVCVAGVRLDTPDVRWARIFTVGFRDLPSDKQFEKYQVIRLRTQANSSDRRPESLKPLIGATSTCDLISGARELKGAAPSLGLIKPREVDLRVEPNPYFDASTGGGTQEDLFGNVSNPLEASPVVATFTYKCAAVSCRGHVQSLVDWESGRFARRNAHLGTAEMLRRHRTKFLDELCGSSKDTHFSVSNMHQHPESFLVLGLWYPPSRLSEQGHFDF